MIPDYLLFRAWIPKQKRFVYLKNSIDYCKFEQDNKSIWADRFAEIEAIPIFWEYNLKCDAIIQQCTGLKDKNGKLIYEGDTIEGVFVGIGPLMIQRHRLHGYWVTADHKEQYDKLTIGMAEDAVIVGNIFENPELIKETT